MSVDEQKHPQNPETEQPIPAPEDAADDRFSAFDQPIRPEEKKKRSRKRITPRLRTLFIALGGVVLLTGILLLVLYLPRSEQPASSGSAGEEITYPLIDKGTSEDTGVVTSLQVKNAQGSYTLTFDTKEKDYTLNGYEDLTLDSHTIQSLTEAAAALTASSKLESTGNMADYGLKQPVATVTAAYRDNTTHVLQIGNAIPSGTGYYVSLDDSREVYICDSSTMEQFLQADTALISTLLLTSPSVKSDDKDGKVVLRELTVSGSNHDYPLSIRRAQSGEGTEVAYSSYVLTKPYYRGVAETASNALANLTYLYASHAVALHPTKTQLATYGLNNPGTVAKITLAVETSDPSADSDDDAAVIYYNSVSVTLRIGKQDADGNYYVLADGTNAVFSVTASTLEPIVERQYRNTVSDLLFIKDITTLGRVDITLNGTSHRFTLTHHADEEDNEKSMTVTENGKTYSTPDFRTLYQRMMTFSRYTEKDTEPAGTPSLQLALYTTDGARYMHVKFYPVSGSLYCIETSEGETFSTKASAVEDFIVQYQNYLAGKAVLEP